MKIKYKDSVLHNIKSYSTFKPSSESKTVQKDGKTYTLVGKSEKNYTLGQQVKIGIISLFKQFSPWDLLKVCQMIGRQPGQEQK